MMDLGFVAWILIGAAAGWLAGLLAKGGGFGIVVDVAAGIAGGAFAGFAANYYHVKIGLGPLDTLAPATLGALALVAALKVSKRHS